MEKTDPKSRIVVCDAGPLIHLDEVNCLDLLVDFSEVIVPDAVWLEVQKHRNAALNHPALHLNKISATTLPEHPVLETMAKVFSLHTGEWEALRLALEFRGCLLLSDDTAARLAEDNLGIKTHGTLGILIRAIRRKQRTKNTILSLLRQLPTLSTLHLNQKLEVEKQP